MNDSVALYWDFENIHATLYDLEKGHGSYRSECFAVQDAMVDVAAITEYAAQLGEICINKAYANWQWFSRYRYALNENGLELVQLFHRGMKNSADIRLALDVLEDLHRFPHITHVVVVSSDSDFVSLAQKVKQSGRRIIGLGLREVSNPFWLASCNEFKFYDTLPGVAGGEDAASTPAEASPDEARALLTKALQLLAPAYADGIPRSALKSFMRRLDGSFDEKSFGFASFGSFVAAFPDLLESVDNDSGGVVRPLAAVAAAEQRGSGAAATYARVLTRGGLYLVPGAWRRQAVEQVAHCYAQAPDHAWGSFSAFEEDVLAALRQGGVDADAELVHRLRGLYFRLRMFRLLGPDGISLEPPVDAAEMNARIDREIVERIIRYGTPPVDERALAEMLFGEADESALAALRPLLAEGVRDDALAEEG